MDLRPSCAATYGLHTLWNQKVHYQNLNFHCYKGMHKSHDIQSNKVPPEGKSDVLLLCPSYVTDDNTLLSGEGTHC
jgi:hypothetical protein